MAINDDVVYACLLLFSIPLGLLVRTQATPRGRELLCTISGILIVILTCRQHSLHSALLVLVNSSICMLSSKRFVHIISFSWCFGYLFFFRTCHWYGLPQASPHSNAVQLLLTLRLVGLAGEIHDTHELKNKLSQLTEADDDYSTVQLQYKHKSIHISIYRIISYSYCYIGALTGPFYTCRTYQDMLEQVREVERNHLPLWSELKQRLRPLPVCALLFLLTSSQVSIQVAREDAFYDDTSYLYRYGYVCIMCFVLFRTRFYSAWILAECMCVTAGLGAYPTQAQNIPGGGPTNLQALDAAQNSEETERVEYDYKTITNILPYETEFSTTIRSTIRTWNMTVQWWLASHVYKKIPIQQKTVRGIILMMISAYWHGVHPGWYATFLSAPFLMLAEDIMRRGLRQRITNVTALSIHDHIASFIRMRFFEYFAVGAHFLQYSHIIRYWSSIYFIGHWALLLLILTGQLLNWQPNQKSN